MADLSEFTVKRCAVRVGAVAAQRVECGVVTRRQVAVGVVAAAGGDP
jgi:hypothetical protein